jgi:hypothetical protein
MNKVIFIAIFCFVMVGCKKEEFDIDKPNVAVFVNQIKAETYSIYELDKNGEKLWLKMPKFTKSHIPALLILAEDTTHVNIFPTNPLSSRNPFPEGRDYFILGECLLWTVEGVRNETGYGSLDPYLVNHTDPNNLKALKGIDILSVRERYRNWWDNYKDSNWKTIDPLEGTIYNWF